MHLRRMLVLLLLPLLPWGASLVRADSPLMETLKLAPLVQQEQMRRWQAYLASLTPRQRHLVYAIEREEEAYARVSGHAIPLTRANHARLMARIGAAPHEANFVLERMQGHVRSDQAWAKTYRELDAWDQQACRALGLFCR